MIRPTAISQTSVSHRVEWQRETRTDPKQRMAFCIDLIGHKIDGCIKTLEKSIRRSPAWEQAIKRSYADLTRGGVNTQFNLGQYRVRVVNTIKRMTGGVPARQIERAAHILGEATAAEGGEVDCSIEIVAGQTCPCAALADRRGTSV